ncbi:MAG TPA: HlyD family efflux transporter periplasmic adaptor subunit [Thermoanaerobaculia bacterium]|nr:HlyD family efflux transporter periplasmic adaptor subunit [Thermoanaerobaculia bacterium]
MRRTILFTIIGIIVVSISVGISRLQPAAPTADRESLFMGKVQRGEMLREVRGPGTLVPVDIRVVSIPVEGRVESIPALPGVQVTPDTVILELSNPELQQNLFEAESELRAAEADLEDLRAQLESQLLNQQAQVAQAESEAEQATLQVEADQKLFKDQLIPELDLKLSRLRNDQLIKRARIERERIQKARNSNAAQLSAQNARVAQLRALYDLRQRQVANLRVRAGIPGVLQELPVQVGQRMTPGATLARVARPEKLKAELRIPEVQAKDVVAGMPAVIDTRNGEIRGRVERVAPSVQEGSVLVDVRLEGPLPRGARPDLTVDGTITIERIPDTIYMQRPTYGQQDQKIEVFKLVEEGNAAVRVPVQFGRTSVNTIEVKSGLAVGDEVIISDVSQWDGHQRIRLD